MPVRDAIERDTRHPMGGSGYLRRLRQRCVDLLGGDLSAPERAQAGDALAALGDPRFNPEAWYLPDDGMLGFVEIPAGAFTMGSDDPDDSIWNPASPAHPLTLPRYYISRYPVTVGQFQVFVNASGYQSSYPYCLEGVSNHPVVWVSWQDAMAYCDWLTEQFRSHLDTLPEPLAERIRDAHARVILPSEAEWEKVARGPNGFFYPWSNEADPNRANYGDTGINTTSAVGCFPGGASIPYGIEDLSGNVWEWTRSIQEDYPYPHDTEGRFQREDLQSTGDEPRVLRGGAFGLDPRLVRCAVRFDLNARDAGNLVGFRVVLSSLP